MPTYAIGDVQGCYGALTRLLDHINFNPAQDRLWFAGDLVNRGEDSLSTLRFIQSLGPRAQVVLGNHDLHLLAVYYGVQPQGRSDTLDPVLNAADAQALIDWLCEQPLLYHDTTFNTVLVHAGIPPIWTLAQATQFAREVEGGLQADPVALLSHLYGDEPAVWADSLTGADRMRVIVNYFTRMRLCDAQGQLALAYKGGLQDLPQGYQPWFAWPRSIDLNTTILFGHWAALEADVTAPGVIALDAGCVWGGRLLALRLDDRQVFAV